MRIAFATFLYDFILENHEAQQEISVRNVFWQIPENQVISFSYFHFV